MKTLQNTCNDMPVRHASGTTVVKGVEAEKAAKTPAPLAAEAPAQLADKASAPLAENDFSKGLNQINSPSSGSILGIF
jgi:biotin carboxyl carrier protein